MRSIGIGAAIIVMVLVGVVTWWPWSRSEPSMADPNDAHMVILGQEIYGERCASCHGKYLEGQKDWHTRGADGRLPSPPHNESGHSWHHADVALFAITKRGIGAFVGVDDYETDMPAFEGQLTDEQILAVIAYIKSAWDSDTQRKQWEIDQRSRTD